VARISDRIIDCPVKVIVIVGDGGGGAAGVVHTIANTKNRPVFNMVANLVFPLSLFINILGFRENLSALDTGPADA
jgi:hypothetical protein